MTDPETTSTDIAERESRFDDSLRRREPLGWWSTLLAPPLLTAIIAAAIGLVSGPELLGQVVLRAVTAFFVLGKFAILEPTTAMSPEALFGLILYMDLMVAVFTAFHLGFLFRLPWLGPRLRSLVSDGQFMLRENPWMRRATFAGLIAFVTFPVASTGSVGGAVFARLIGLDRRLTILGIGIGSVVGCGVMYFGATVVRAYLDPDSPIVKLGGLAIILAMIVWLNVRYRRAKTRSRTASSRST